MKKFVLDTSVIVKWFSDEPGSAKSKDLLIGLENGNIEIYIPELVKYELANAFLKGKGLVLVQAKIALKIFYSLPLVIVAEDFNLAKKSYQFAEKIGITYYDACFLALAKIKSIPLITSNPKHQKIKRGVEIIVI